MVMRNAIFGGATERCIYEIIMMMRTNQMICVPVKYYSDESTIKASFSLSDYALYEEGDRVMGLKDLFKKNKPTASSTSVSTKISTEDMVNKIYVDTGKKIQEGLSKETASTGTPMKKLKGAALFTATMSNI